MAVPIMQPLDRLQDEYLGEKEAAGGDLWQGSFRFQHILDQAVQRHDAPTGGPFWRKRGVGFHQCSASDIKVNPRGFGFDKALQELRCGDGATITAATFIISAIRDFSLSS